MKGLLLMKKMNKLIPFVMYLFAAAIAFFYEEEVYALLSSAIFSLFIGMHLMMTMTYDGMSSWKEYELTLPMSNYQIIAGKYAVSILLTPISVIGTSLLHLLRFLAYHSFSFSLFGFSLVIAIILPVLWCCVCLAIAQWFGYMSVQYVRVGATLLALLLLKKAPNDTEYAIQHLIQSPMLIALAVLFVIVVSYFVSVTGYARKE